MSDQESTSTGGRTTRRWSPIVGLAMYVVALVGLMTLARRGGPVWLKEAVAGVIGVALYAYRCCFLRYEWRTLAPIRTVPVRWRFIERLPLLLGFAGLVTSLSLVVYTITSLSGLAVVAVPVVIALVAVTVSRRNQSTDVAESAKLVDRGAALLTFSVSLVIGGGVVAIASLLHGDGFALGGAAIAFLSFGELIALARTDPRVSLYCLLLSSVATPLLLVAGLVALPSAPTTGRWLVVVAVLLAPVVLNFGSQVATDSLRGCSIFLYQKAWFAVATILIALGSLLLWITWHSYLITALAVILLVLLTWLIASNVNWDLLFVALALVIVWAVVPRSAQFPEELNPQADKPTIVALGDSYTSGEGAGVYYEDTNNVTRDKATTDQCRRAPTAYPVVIVQGRRKGPPTTDERLLFVACSGAKGVNVTETVQYPPEKQDQLHKFLSSAIAAQDIDVVLISLGGNDAAFGTVVQTCFGPGNCDGLKDVWNYDLTLGRDELRNAYAAIAGRVDPAKVVVIPYPIPISETKCKLSPLSESDHQYVTTFTRSLNRVVYAEAHAVGFAVATTVEDALKNAKARVCDQESPSRWGANLIAFNPTASPLMQAILPTNWVHNTAHPNPRGHQIIADTLETWLANRPPADATWDVTLTDSPRPDGCGSATDTTCETIVDKWSRARLATFAVRSFPLILILLGAWISSFRVGHALERLNRSVAQVAAQWARMFRRRMAG